MKAWQSPRVQELIRKPDLTEYRSYPRTQQQAGNCLTEATDGRVVLGYDHHPAASRGLLADCRLVERLDGGHMQHADIDPVVPQRLRGLERAHGHEARRDDQRIAPIAKELGFPELLRDGRDALIISTGFMTMRALEAAETLRDDRVDIGVLHVPTIKPLDEAQICKQAARSGRMVIVAENHTTVGGLGEAVAGLLLRSGITPIFRQIGLPDEFLDAGALPSLHERYGISAEAVAKKIKAWQAQ